MAARPPGDGDIRRARSYDDVAEAYERVNAPLLFDAPARALVECAALAPGTRVLDVGAGTGAVARAAIAVGADVIGLDPSLPMLMVAGRGGVSHLVCGALPELPFGDAVFDRVLSAFVMTHVDDPESAVRDMQRVLRPGGWMALSAWAPSDDACSAAWSEVVHEFADPDVVGAAAGRVLPGETRFSQRDGLAGLLDANGFAAVRTVTRTFAYRLDLDAMAGAREVCATGRSLRTLLSDEKWREFQARVRDVLGKKFPGGAGYDRDIFIALGQKR